MCKTAEPIQMPFGLWTWLDPRKHVLMGPTSHAKGQLLRERTCLGIPDDTCCELWKNGWTDRFAVWVIDSDGLKESQVLLHSIRHEAPLCPHRRAHWRNVRMRLNRLSAAAMRPYDTCLSSGGLIIMLAVSQSSNWNVVLYCCWKVNQECKEHLNRLPSWRTGA